MAKIVIEVPDELVLPMIKSFAIAYGANGGAPCWQNVKAYIKQYIIDVHRHAEAMQIDAQFKTSAEIAHDAVLLQAEEDFAAVKVS